MSGKQNKSITGKSNEVGWESSTASYARELLDNAYRSSRPVVLLLGAGLSAESGIPLASQLSQYLVQVSAMVRRKGFANARQYLEEMRWPGRHDLRIDLMLELHTPTLRRAMKNEERIVTQAALVSELRRSSPTFAFGLDEIFGQLRGQWNRKELAKEFGELASVARGLAKRVPRNVAYRSLLFHLCDSSQALIDGCLDHFIRDRSPTTTHQLIVFLTQLLRSSVVLSTNFDPLLERAFGSEGIIPRVYEIQGEGTIPSARMLLSQHFSIVKLHGGAHQMRTGFDLDDPLSPAVLASFYELFDRLAEESGQKPLMLVMGYSGSDRRVMDIVNTHIKRWQRHEEPCVLWQNRDRWIPDLLRAAVETHPHVLYRQDRNEIQGTQRSPEYNRFPAHIVRYADGRLFLLEAYQHLARSFPIGKSHYQAVNFVPHSTVRSENRKKAKALHAPNATWRMAMIAAEIGGGSSSQLADLAQALDSEYRIVWIDMAEVPGVSSLVDVVAERLAKFDHRLQPLRRPLLLNSLLYDRDLEAVQPQAMIRVESSDMELTVKWFQHALRRGQYLIALDSLDEFPASHPATQMIAPELIRRQECRFAKEAQLLCRLLHHLMDEPRKLGDSRIAVATAVCHAYSNRNSRHNQRPEIDNLNQSLFALQETFRRRAGDSPEISFVQLPGKSSLSDVDSPQQMLMAWEKFAFPVGEAKDLDTGMSLQQGAIILAVAACARRIRSEVSITQVSSHLLGTLKEQNKTLRQMLDEGRFGELLRRPSEVDSARSRGTKINADYEDCLVEWIRLFTGEGRWSESCDWAVLPTVSGEQKGNSDKNTRALRWFYRIEGGYQWMHRTVRDGLYEELLSMHKEFACTLHHRLAEFCHHHLYDRSRDARAFLEYLFHRTAAIKLVALISATSQESQCAEWVERSVDWLRRAVRALQREKSAMMTMARLPSLIYQLRQLITVVGESIYPQIDRAKHLGDPRAERRKEEVDLMVMDVFGILGDLLLAAGHPHSAVRCHVARVHIASNRGIPCPVADLSSEGHSLGSIVDKSSGGSWKLVDIGDQPFKIREMSIMSDLANAIQDPLLSHSELPPPFHRWTEEVVGGHNDKPLDRHARVEICRSIYGSLLEYCNEVQEDVDAHYDPKHREHEIELSRTIMKRRLEFERLSGPTPFLSTVNFYANPDTDIPIWGQPLKEATNSMSQLDEVHAWRVTSKGPRHECYRLCLQAQRIATYNLRNDSMWARIQGLFGDAEAVLGRHDDPADLQALAITRLIFAEHCIRRAEVLAWWVDKELTKHKLLEGLAPSRFKHEGGFPPSQSFGRMARDIDTFKLEGLPETLAHARFCHDQAIQLLSSVDNLLNEGRGEIRWRFYYLVTLARSRMFQAMRVVDDAPVKAMNEINWSGRYLVAALGNCGKWTDRRFVLTSWWHALRTYMRNLIGNDEQFAQEWARLRAQNGVDWNLNWRNPE